MLARAIVRGSRQGRFIARLMSASGPETIPASVCLIIALTHRRILTHTHAHSRTRCQPPAPGLLDRSDQRGEGRAKTLSFALHV